MKRAFLPSRLLALLLSVLVAAQSCWAFPLVIAADEEGKPEDSSSEEVQKEQNVQESDDSDAVQIESQALKPTLGQLMASVQHARRQGVLEPSDFDALRDFLRQQGADDEQIELILDRFPTRDHRQSGAGLEISRAVIPQRLLKRQSDADSLQPAGMSSQQDLAFVSQRVLLRVSSPEAAARLQTEAGDALEMRSILDGERPLLMVQATDEQSTLDLLNHFYADEDVLAQEPDFVYEPAALPNDPDYLEQWHHFNDGGSYAGFTGTPGEDLDTELAWDIFRGDGSTVVAVIDSGVMLNHPDLQDRLWDGSSCVDENGASISGGCPFHGFDYYDFDDNPNEEGSHGTRVAGIIAASGNNGLGVAGLNWNGQIMALKVGAGGSGYFSNSAIISSIYFAVHNGADIINASFAASVESQLMRDAVDFARQHDVLLVTAAGNAGLDLDQMGNDAFPCEMTLDNVICVAATNLDGGLSFTGGSSSSNYGQNSVDLAAPGSLMYSTTAEQTVVYSNNFEQGSMDLNAFLLSGGSDWGLNSDASNQWLTSHVSGAYDNNENSFAELNQDLDLSAFEAGTLIFEMSCDTEDAFDADGFPVDGVGIEFSSDGGVNWVEVEAYNGALTDARGLIETGPNGFPLITIGLIEEDFTSQFRFRFRFSSDGQNVGQGCQIDELRLQVTGTASYVASNGTSFAAPVVAGLASLIWEYDLSLTYQQVIDQLKLGGETLPSLTSTTISGKRVNAYRSLALMTDPAVIDLRGFVSDGGVEFFDGDSVTVADPYFSWTAPIDQGVIDGYSFAVDDMPDATVDTTDLFTTLSGLSEGAHSFSVVGLNDVGVMGTVATLSFDIDTMPPDAPSGLSVNGGTDVVLADNVDVTEISGMASEAGELNYVVSDGVNPDVVGSLSVTSGAFSVSGLDLSSLNDGALTLTAQLIDAAGNTSPSVDLILEKDTEIETPSQIQLNGGQPITAATTNPVSLSFATAEAGEATYSISDGTTELTGVVTLGAAGTTTISSLDTSGLADTTLQIGVGFTDVLGNVAADGNATLIKDTQVSSVTNLQVNDGQPVNAAVEGTLLLSFVAGEPGSADWSLSDGTTTIALTAAVAGSGTTTISGIDASGLNDGPLTFSVSFRDVVGNSAAAVQVSSSKDTQVSAATNVQLNGGQVIVKATASNLELTFDVSEAGTTDYVISDGISSVQDSLAVNSGSVTVSGIDVRTLADGTLTVTVAFTDSAGNVAPSVNTSAQKDAQVSSPSNVSLNGGQVINAADEAAVDLLFDVSEAGTTDYVMSDGSAQLTESTVSAAAESVTVSALDLRSLSDGVLTVTLTFTDTVGNVSDPVTTQVEKDVTVQAVSNLQLNGGQPVNASQQAKASLSFEVQEAGEAVYSIRDGGKSLNGSLVIGAGSTTQDVDLSSLNDGTLDVSVTFTDAAGNTAPSVSSSVDKDTVVSPASDVQLNGGTVILAADQYSVDLTLTTSEAGTAVYEVSDGVDALTGSLSVAGGVATVDGLDVSALADGPLALSVLFTDVAGNEAAAANGLVQKDAVITTPTNVQLNEGQLINSPIETAVDLVFDTTEAGSADYQISDGSTELTGTVPVTVAGTMTVAALDVSGLADGTLTITVSFTDQTGNTAPDATATVVKQSEAPNAPTNVQLNGNQPVNASQENAVSLTGQVDEAGTLLYAIVDENSQSVTGSQQVTTGPFSVANLDLSVLTDGFLMVYVTLTDTNANTSADTQVQVLLDTQVQSLSAIHFNDDQPVNAAVEAAVELRFEAPEVGRLQYRISDGNQSVTDTQLVSAGSQSISGIDVSGLDDGLLALTLDFKDEAGNAAPSLTLQGEKDTTVDAPTALSVQQGQAVTQATQSAVFVSLTVVEAGTLQYHFSDGTDVLSGTVAVTAGTQTLGPFDLQTLADGSLNVEVQLTDAVGNTSNTFSASFFKDTLVNPPSNVQLNGGLTIDNANVSTVSLTFEADESGIASYVLSDGTQRVTGTETVNAAGTVTVNGIDARVLADGPVTAEVMLRDQVGNESVVASSAAVTKQADLQPGGGVFRRRSRLRSVGTEPEPEPEPEPEREKPQQQDKAPEEEEIQGSVMGLRTEQEQAPEPSEPEERFLDLKADHPAYAAVIALVDRGVVQGPDQVERFYPERSLDRAQALKMLLLLTGYPLPEALIERPFADVEVDAWFAPFFAVAQAHDFLRGYADGRVIPWQEINRAEAVVLAYRVMALDPVAREGSVFEDVEADVWYGEALHDAIRRGLLSSRETAQGVLAEPTKAMSRAEFAELIVGLWRVRGE